MNSNTDTATLTGTSALRRAADFVELAKPRVVLMVLITTFVGFYLGSEQVPDYLVLVQTLIGTALAAGGTLALNQYMERDTDAVMQRTQRRPLPDGRLQPREAVWFGIAVTILGLVYLALTVNLLSACVTAFITISYLLFYTPLKRRSSLCMLVGAVPGALPPVIGWVATRGIVGSRCLGAVRDHVSLAGAAYPGDRPALPRRLRQGRHHVSAGDRAGRRQHQSPDHQS